MVWEDLAEEQWGQPTGDSRVRYGLIQYWFVQLECLVFMQIRQHASRSMIQLVILYRNCV